MRAFQRAQQAVSAILTGSTVCVTIMPANAAAPFTEEAIARGVVFYQHPSMGMAGQGIAFADLDGDLDDDLVILGAVDGRVGIYENKGGQFIDRSSVCGLNNGLPTLLEPTGVVAADFDGDGRVDLFFTQACSSCTGGYEPYDRLARNLGDFTFTDVTEASGLLASPERGQGSCFGDYDSDGFLDLYVSINDSEAVYNRLYRNLNGSTFVETTEEAGVREGSNWFTFQAGFWDYDRDGDVDLYMGNDKGLAETGYQGNRLWRNDGDGGFTEVTAESGTGAQIAFMGMAIGDINNDLWPDLYMSNYTIEIGIPTGNPLYVNRGNGTFNQANVEAGVEASRWGWGVVFFDFDNNRHEDIYVCNVPVGVPSGANLLYKNSGTFPLVDVADEFGVAAPGFNYTVAVSDIDSDGDLDLAVGESGGLVKLYINHEGELKNWIKLNLQGNAPNVNAVGSFVDLFADGITQHRQVMAGVGFKSSSSMTVHFGLGDVETIEEIVIHWHGGPVQHLFDIDVNQTLNVSQPAAPTLVHGADGVSFGDHAFGGFIDSRSESADGVNADLGLSSFRLVFGEPVFGLAGGPVVAGDFTVTESGGGNPLIVVSVDESNNPNILVTLDRPIRPQVWTTIRASVINADGAEILNVGNLGPGLDEPDRIDVSLLPGDIDQNGETSPFDLLLFRQLVQGNVGVDRGVVADYLDMDRSGVVTPFDILVYRQLVAGVSPPATQAWAGETLLDDRP
jgi:ASPIC and UnbV/FG-GAP-like repeat/FG-GAP repeat